MYSKFQLAKKYFQYLLNSSNGKGHGVHSPFVFEFITKVMNDKSEYDCYKKIEALREELKKDPTVLSIEDFGAGSRVANTKQRTVASVAVSALKPKKFSQLLFRMVHFYKPENILELGTSLGITTSYLASGNENAQIKTLEGASAVAFVARNNFAKLQLNNIELIEGNFDETLSSVIREMPIINFSFVDGNHRKEPTVHYFYQLFQKTNEHSILIFDDIHWSKEMEEAWKEIQSHPSVTVTIDLFFIGIVFFRKENKVKQHFVIRF